MDYNRARFHWMSIGRDSVLECASVLALSNCHPAWSRKSAKTLAHSKTLSRPNRLLSIQTQMVLVHPTDSSISCPQITKDREGACLH